MSQMVGSLETLSIFFEVADILKNNTVSIHNRSFNLYRYMEADDYAQKMNAFQLNYKSKKTF